MPLPIVPTLAALAVVLTATGLHAQPPAAPAAPAPPSCRADLDSLAQRIAADYAGVQLEIVGPRRLAYDRALDSLRASADRRAPDGCFPVLNALTASFADPHLFVFQSTRIDSAEARRRREAVPVLALDEAAVRRDLARRAARLDPIEGIWYDGPLRLAVVPEPGAPRGRYAAVVLVSDSTSWPVGAVRARFTRRPDGAYDADVSTRDYGRRTLVGRIHKRLMLRLSPGIWGKAYPVAPTDRGLLDSTDVHRATFVLRGGTAIVSIPSHDPTYRGALDTLLATHATALQGAERLIVDLRGNEGGSSWMTNGLLPYLRSARRRPTPFDSGDAVMLASPDQQAYARRAFGPDTSRFVRTLLERMRAHPGELVPLRDPADPRDDASPDTLVVGPPRVGVLIDRGTVSAAEVLVLDALRSERATVFGEPTAGALDYQSVNVVPIAAAERRWYLGYPTITARASLPAGGMRGRGIAPDVRVDWARVADPIGWVDAALRR
ncbi:MAG: hypothetical protein JO180_07765 [Gemmatirosa sp.]|nr:hypothetical protein [Gemmatirosa sp.]